MRRRALSFLHKPLRRDVDFRPRVVICGSMTFLPQMMHVHKELGEAHVPSVLPTLEDGVTLCTTLDTHDSVKRKLSLDHIRRIKNPSTFAILVVNMEKHGEIDYIGPNAFAEIAIAFATGKQIFLLNDVPHSYSDELTAWGATPLAGRVDYLVARHHSRLAELQPRQLSFFEDW
ncbi:conserved hypothetical protein [Magnetospirillum sp. UT-4]|nr:conserved hypothetical protein [Magnetospirillum sp. UT-4]